MPVRAPGGRRVDASRPRRVDASRRPHRTLGQPGYPERFTIATFQSFLLVCGYVIVFLLMGELTWRFAGNRWLAVWPLVTIGALEAALGLFQNFRRGVDQVRWGTFVNLNARHRRFRAQ